MCFITDEGHCAGAAGVGTDGSSSGGSPDWDLDNQQQCINSGYSCTPCQEWEEPVGNCPFDSSCHAECVSVCPPENTQTCTGPDETGVGDACEGLYASCCKLCSDYPYDEVKAGYVEADSCTDCDGKVHYKLKCDVGNIGSGSGSYFDCGESGGATDSETCIDDESGKTYYSECKCPLNQEWSTVTKECVCATSFKYDCQGSAYAATQTGNTCDDKYSSCDCAEGFTWDAESGLCACDGTDWCTLNQDCTALGYSPQTCSGKTLRCPFDPNYTICFACGSSYQYTCTGTGEIGSGTACGGKYAACTCASGYEWKNGSCQKQVLNGAIGDLYYCNNKVVGVKAGNMNFYVAMKDLGQGNHNGASNACSNYVFCNALKGTLPSKSQLLTMYNNKTALNNSLTSNGGKALANDTYWPSTYSYSSYYIAVSLSSGDSKELDRVYNYASYRPVLTSW